MSPIVESLRWGTVVDGAFWFKKIPAGLARIRHQTFSIRPAQQKYTVLHTNLDTMQTMPQYVMGHGYID